MDIDCRNAAKVAVRQLAPDTWRSIIHLGQTRGWLNLLAGSGMCTIQTRGDPLSILEDSHSPWRLPTLNFQQQWAVEICTVKLKHLCVADD